MRKILSLITAAAISAGSMAVTAFADEGDMRDITTSELVSEMGVGINLGNTFEACGSWINASSVTNYETAWGSPVITQEMIQGVADEGFGVIRIPVAWSNMMDMDDYTISEEYMDRVKEVTQWAVDAGLYVIVNIHWDGGWWEDFPTDTQECMYRYTRMWQQICDGFADFDDHVVFESLNEEGGWSSVWDQWSGTQEQKEQSYALLNEINQTFVDLVRSQDNNNAQRHLLIAGYTTDINLTCDELFVMPQDELNRCAVSVHYYTPSSFAIADANTTWTTPKTFWGTQTDYNELSVQIEKLKTRFIDNGIPVIVGECGCASQLNKTQEECISYNLATMGALYDAGCCPVLWDVTMGEDSEERIYSYYSRALCKIADESFKAGLADITSGKAAAEITTSESIYYVEGVGEFSLEAASTSGAALTYTSLNEDIAAVDENGIVTPISDGIAKIAVSAAATDEYRTARYIVLVSVKTDSTSSVNSSSSSSSQISDTDASSDSDTSSDTSSQADSSSAVSSSSKAASGGSSSNPATGAAAGLGLTALLTAAIVAVKRKK